MSLAISEQIENVDSEVCKILPPSACDTIVFGKGTGESILVRISDNEWIIVDSCLNNKGKPAALDYLTNNNIDIKNDVKLIIISHFHDDHISGLSDIIESCCSATLVISAALNTEDFNEYIDALSKTGVEMAKTKEIKRIMGFFPSLLQKQRLLFAKKDCTLFRSQTGIEIHSLSPSDNDIAQSDLDFSNYMKIAKNLPDIASSAKIVNPNHYCVVSRIFSPSSTDNEILLGADLEVKTDRGWDSVCCALNSPKPNKVGIFKLPHHGSKTGFHQKTWDDLIRSKPISIMTTYDSSSLPREDMVSIYKERSSSLHCTSQPKPYVKRPKKNTDSDTGPLSEAKKILAKMDTSVSFSEVVSRFGYVKVTNCLTPAPSVTVHEAAVTL